ncbi:hypothetical protein N7492_004779 [Penicillium capsulatum]|uniref:PHD-type domain-containing protein n=1 Tax=Penicillium capsulatum TaxID=69766 RepID=A0A9W9IB02_9EURO|nr:hypothetical protein N7492_004779 [Penicillium capsulatum]KAJ6136113.1 hypothetical protein N7512_001273 [Penicillium capsulatum]
MKVVSTVIDMSLPSMAPSDTNGDEVPQHQTLAQASDELKAHPKSGLKLVFGRSQSTQEVPLTESSARQTTRMVKQPATIPTTKVPKQQMRGTRKKETTVVCTKCNRGHSPATNMIVFCDGCDGTWHQRCHDPPIDNEVVRVEEAEWFCNKCKPEPTPAAPMSPSPVVSKPIRIIHPRLQQAPRLDVGANQFSPDETRAYLSSLSHAALVELVVNVSAKNPKVAMFPANLRDLPASAFPGPSARPEATMKSKKRTRSVSAVLEKPEESGPARKLSRKTSTATKPPVAPAQSKSRKASASSCSAHPSDPTFTAQSKPTRATKPRQSHRDIRDTSTPISEPQTDETSDDEMSEVDDHRAYPEAGKGFFPSSMDPAILDLLQEGPNCPSISHALHGLAKLDHALQKTRTWGPKKSN